MGHYDPVVIGSGSGGFSAAIAAKVEGLDKILLVEKRPVGYSLCTNDGCMPSKISLASASVKRILEESSNFGITSSAPKGNWDTVQQRVRTLIEDDFFAARRDAICNAPVDVAEVHGNFAASHAVRVGERVYTGKRIVIATKSTINVPPIPGLTKTGYIDSNEELYLDKLSSSLIPIASGYIAMELECFFHKMDVEVTILVRGK